MSDGSVDLAKDARARAYALPIEAVNPAQSALFQSDTHWPYFERLRREDPVHYVVDKDYGPYWSITKFNDIMAVETNHQVFSSDSTLGGITIGGQAGGDGPRPMFISMDPPKHDVQRKAVSPAVSPANLATLEPIIRERAGAILDSLPIGEEFDWVDKVSIELTTMTLATLFDFPFEERRKLTRWSDVITAIPGHGVVDSMEQKMAEMMECFQYFGNLWNERVNAPPAGDLISMMAHAEATRNMEPREFQGNIVLLIVGGNDTYAEHHHRQRLGAQSEPGSIRCCAPIATSSHRWCRRRSAGRRLWLTCAARPRRISSSRASRSKRATRSSCGTSPGQPRRRGDRGPR